MYLNNFFLLLGCVSNLRTGCATLALEGHCRFSKDYMQKYCCLACKGIVAFSNYYLYYRMSQKILCPVGAVVVEKI